MADQTKLYGFDGSTYVRTVKTVLNDKGVDFDQAQINVLEGEPRQPEHLARHPFGKVPVLDIDGIRIRETDAICRYLEDTRPDPALIPDKAREKALMNEAMSLINAYGYDALIGAAGYHLFPEFIGGPDDDAHAECMKAAKTLLELLMENKGQAKWLAGDAPTLADYFLAPIMFYISLTPDKDALLQVPGMADWWQAMQGVASFKATEPDLG
ncbi:glutathione S-transferase [Rhodovulum iodosum]|uniref:glutathione transferase n=1 Tax=Rhodovulum iodosum TaxID=68291 RepID=A0ABV3XQZ8_9RHOB|nr:glutathione S-transferase family protein [Rhodovulum robiginosum]RSK32865.1 glutathione S-transferase family protein [Rhodovulum robiginosum]